MQVQPYLFFDGRCDEALEFYAKAVGAKVGTLLRFKDGPDKSMAAANADKVMHAQFQIGESKLFASDGRASGQPKFDGFALTITAGTAAEADKLFAALADGGKVTMPLAQTFFSPRFGMLVDRFGVHWIVLAAQ